MFQWQERCELLVFVFPAIEATLRCRKTPEEAEMAPWCSMPNKQDLRRTLITDHPDAVGYADRTHSSPQVDLAEAMHAALARPVSNIDWENPDEPSLYDLVDQEPSIEPRTTSNDHSNCGITPCGQECPVAGLGILFER